MRKTWHRRNFSLISPLMYESIYLLIIYASSFSFRVPEKMVMNAGVTKETSLKYFQSD